MHSVHLSSAQRFLRSTSILGLLALSAFSADAARAQQCAPDNGVILCEGSLDQPVLIDGTDVSVVTASGFSVQTASDTGPALAITGAGSLSYLDENASTLTSTLNAGLFISSNFTVQAVDISATTDGNITGSEGIVIDQRSSGSVKLVSTGLVTGSQDEGVLVKTGPAPGSAIDTSIDLSLHEVLGQSAGVKVDYRGIDDATIAASGSIAAVGDGGTGLDIDMASSSHAATIDVLDVTGAATGIRINHQGSGKLSLSAQDVVGEVGDGASVLSTGEATLQFGSLTGGTNGALVSHFDAGKLHFAASGPVVGQTVNGLSLVSGANTGSVTVEAGDVSGALNGIVMTVGGVGRTKVGLTGTLTGADGNGLGVTAGETMSDLVIDVVDVVAGKTAILVDNAGAGESVIRATGDLVADRGSGVRLRTAEQGTSTIIETRNISSGTAGIDVEHLGSGSIVVKVDGAIDAGTHGILAIADGNSSGATLQFSSVDAGNDAVTLRNFGSGGSTIKSDGVISSTDGSALVTTFGELTKDVTIGVNEVHGATGGIAVTNIGTALTTVHAEGEVSATDGDAINIFSGSNGTGVQLVLTDVTAGKDGVEARNAGADLHVVAAGRVEAGENGLLLVNLEGAGAVSANVADVIAGRHGLIVTNHGTGGTEITAGNVTAGGPAAVAVSNGLAAGAMTVTTSTIAAVETGLKIENLGTGETAITIDGSVSSGKTGVSVSDGVQSGALTLAAGSIDAGADAIVATHRGSGTISITADGAMLAGGSGIIVESQADTTDINVDVADLASEGIALRVRQFGSGESLLSANDVTSAQGVGISFHAAATSAASRIEAASVSGGESGIVAVHAGSGSLTLDVDGDVVGTQGRGVHAMIADNADGMAIAIGGAVTGGEHGVLAQNIASGATDVTVAGPISAEKYGLIAYNAFATTTDILVSVGAVKGGISGLSASNRGSGDTRISATSVEGGTVGVGVSSEASTGLIAVDVADVSAGEIGLTASHYGGGAIDIRATGTVVGEQLFGIQAIGKADAGAVTIAANNALGGEHGVRVLHDGSADTSLVLDGLVEGGVSAIFVNAAGPIAMTLGGETRNASQASHDLAVQTQLGATSLVNEGLLTGRVSLSDKNDTLTNGGEWRVSGSNLFGAGSDALVSAAGSSILVGSDAAVAQTATFDNLESFSTSGLLSLQDGGVGDGVVTDGDLSFGSKAVLAIDVAGGAGARDRVIAGGEIVIADGAVLDVAFNGPLQRGIQHQVLHAGEGLSGSFDFAGAPVSAFFMVEDSYTASDMFIELVKYRDFSLAASTPNQAAVALALDALPVGTLSDAVGAVASDEDARLAFDRLSGEIHAALPAMLLENARQVPSSEALIGTRNDGDRKSAVWGELLFDKRDRDGDGNARSSDASTTGMRLGVDHGVTPWLRLGATGTIARHKVEQSIGDATSTEKAAGVYAAARTGAASLAAGASHAWHDVESRREVAFADFSEVLGAEYDGTLLQAFASAAYDVPVGQVTLSPFAGITYVKFSSGAYAETGGDAALASDGFENDAVTAIVGSRVAATVVTQDVPIRLSGSLGWQRTLGEGETLAVHGFGDVTPFTVATVPLAKNLLAMEASMEAALSDRLRIRAGYVGQLGDSTKHGARIGAAFVF